MVFIFGFAQVSLWFIRLCWTSSSSSPWLASLKTTIIVAHTVYRPLVSLLCCIIILLYVAFVKMFATYNIDLYHACWNFPCAADLKCCICDNVIANKHVYPQIWMYPDISNTSTLRLYLLYTFQQQVIQQCLFNLRSSCHKSVKMLFPCYLIKTYIPKCKKSGLQNFHTKIHRDVGNCCDEKYLMCIYTIKCENGDGRKQN